MEIIYRELRGEDCCAAVALAGKCINSEAAFADYIRELHGHIGSGTAGYGAFDGARIVGLVYYTEGMHLSGGRTDFFKEIRESYGCESVWTANVIAVDDDYRGMKIGKNLSIYGPSKLKELGARHLLFEIWVRPDGYMPGDNVVNGSSDITTYGIIPNFYAEAPGAEDHVCEVCGPGNKCRCSAKIVLAHL